MKRLIIPPMLCVLFSIPILCCMIGCEKRQHVQERVLPRKESDYVVTLLVDMSGSFEELMTEGGYAWQMALRVVDKYFRDRIGNNDRLIIAQISGEEQALLFEGTPHALRKTFPTGNDFATFLRKKSDRLGSSVHRAIVDSLEYTMDRPCKQSMFIVLSDMMSTEPASSREKAVAAVREYGQHGGIVGFYYVAPSLQKGWQRDLANAGLREFCVESKIVARPELPEWVDIETAKNGQEIER